jgi:hypothetical protein
VSPLFCEKEIFSQKSGDAFTFPPEAIMKNRLSILLGSLMLVTGLGNAIAQSSDIRESTDPAKVDDVERRAREIQARQQMSDTGATSGSSDTQGESASGRGKKHHGKHHAGAKKRGHRSSGMSGAEGESGAGAK